MSSCYKLIMPNGYKKNIYYNDTDNKINLVNKQVLEHWEEYLSNHWLWLHKFEQGKLNYEDKTKSLLDRCATFLLLADFQKNKILSDKKRSNIYKKEILLSCTPDDVQDIVYSVDTEWENITQTPQRSSLILDNEIIMNNTNNDSSSVHKKKLPKIMKRYRQSQQYKMKKLYLTYDRAVQKLYKLKNGDLQEKPLNKDLSAEELVKWQNKPFKNIHRENIYEYRTEIMKGNAGLIDIKQPYIWAWCYVDANNEFVFNQEKYQINKFVYQYQGKIKSNSNTYTDVVYDMDMILCYEQGDQYFYFDQNIDRIKNEYIQKIY